MLCRTAVIHVVRKRGSVASESGHIPRTPPTPETGLETASPSSRDKSGYRGVSRALEAQ